MYGVDIIQIVSMKPQIIHEHFGKLLTIFFTEHSLHLSQLFCYIKSLSQLLSKFFIDKILKVRMDFSNGVHGIPESQSLTVESHMTCLEPTTCDESEDNNSKFTYQYFYPH